jgi:hypothetical protein
VIALQMNSTVVDHDASAMSLNLHVGAKYSRFESLSRLIGEGGRSDLLAVAVAKAPAGIRRAHIAGPHLAAHGERSCFTKTRSTIAPARPSAG